MRTWTTADVAKLAGVTARTLRHYDAIGLLQPADTGHGGIRRYGHTQLLRLQQILLLRRLGLRLETIADILDGGLDTVEALRRHAEQLAEERDRLDRLAATVDTTIRQLQGGQPMAPESWFTGLDDHTRAEYDAEARRRWGDKVVERAYAVVQNMTPDERAALPAVHEDISRRVAAARDAGHAPGDPDVQAVIADHYRLIARYWDSTPSAEAYRGLGAMYADDPRFRDNYDSVAPGLAAFMRDAMRHYAADL